MDAGRRESRESMFGIIDRTMAVAQENSQSLKKLQECYNNEVVGGYTYLLHAKLPPKNESEQSWCFQAEPLIETVGARLEEWTYHGDSLEVPDEDLFNDRIDFTLQTVDDIFRLNDEIPPIVNRYKRLANTEDNRADARKFLSNLEKMQRAINELHELTQDVPDKISNSKDITEGMGQITSGFARVRNTLENATLKLNAKMATGSAAQTAPALGSLVRFCKPETIHNSATLTGHEGYVHSLAAFKNDKHIACLASGGTDGTIRLWNLRTGENYATLRDHMHDVNSLVYYTDAEENPCIASAGADRAVCLWNLQTLEKMATLKGHTGAVNCVAVLSSAGKVPMLASGSTDKTIRIWKLGAGGCQMDCAKLTGHGHFVWSLALFTKSDKEIPYLASGSGDRTIKLWNLLTYENTTTLTGHKGYVSTLTAYANSDKVAFLASGSGDHTIKVWNLETEEQVVTLEGHAGDIWCLVPFTISHQTPCLASGSTDHTIKLWNVKTQSLITTLEGHSSWVRYLAVTKNADNKPILVSASDDKTIKIWSS